MLHLLRLSRPHYESDAGRFLDELKADRSGLEARQQKGRLLLWDKAPIDLDRRQREREARVPQRAYVYQDVPVLPTQAKAKGQDA